MDRSVRCHKDGTIDIEGTDIPDFREHLIQVNRYLDWFPNRLQIVPTRSIAEATSTATSPTICSHGSALSMPDIEDS
jgi:hypothetical protein